MGKILVGAAIGIFVGAFTVEIINRKSPNALRELADGFSKIGNAVARAFGDGYRGVSETIETAKAAQDS
jgi:hypothetical protein